MNIYFFNTIWFFFQISIYQKHSKIKQSHNFNCKKDQFCRFVEPYPCLLRIVLSRPLLTWSFYLCLNVICSSCKTEISEIHKTPNAHKKFLLPNCFEPFFLKSIHLVVVGSSKSLFAIDIFSIVTHALLIDCDILQRIWYFNFYFVNIFRSIHLLVTEINLDSCAFKCSENVRIIRWIG